MGLGCSGMDNVAVMEQVRRELERCIAESAAAYRFQRGRMQAHSMSDPVKYFEAHLLTVRHRAEWHAFVVSWQVLTGTLWGGEAPPPV